MYKCFIIDDESHAIEILRKYAIKSGKLEIAGTSQHPEQAVQLINGQKDIDITFLDVDMEEMSGLDVADAIHGQTEIIFTTGHSDYAVNAYDKDISDFMLKPISFEKFMKSLNKVIDKLDKKALEKQPKNKDFFFVNPGIKGKMLKINFNDVDYVEGLNNYILIHTPTVNHVIYLTMKEMENGLKPDLFIRIHKSYIINISKVTHLEGNKIYIDNIDLPIGLSYKENLLKQINGTAIKTSR